MRAGATAKGVDGDIQPACIPVEAQITDDLPSETLLSIHVPVASKSRIGPARFVEDGTHQRHESNAQLLEQRPHLLDTSVWFILIEKGIVDGPFVADCIGDTLLQLEKLFEPGLKLAEIVRTSRLDPCLMGKGLSAAQLHHQLLRQIQCALLRSRRLSHIDGGIVIEILSLQGLDEVDQALIGQLLMVDPRQCSQRLSSRLDAAFGHTDFLIPG